jgi:F-type H+-transporting ATPase subunit alpha
MAVDELNFDPKDIAEALRKNVESFTPSVEREEVGRVVEAGDGIARVKGLPGAMANELLEFPGGVLGLAFNLDEDEIGCVVLGESSQIEEGDLVKQTGRILSIPVGDGFLGRVIDPLGVPLDGKGPIPAEETRVLEIQAANVIDRQPVKEPLQTGITAIDAIIAQRDNWASGDPKKQVRCIYVAVGQKASTVAEVVETLSDNGALDYTVIVNASASDPTPFQYLAPYSGAALGAYWMYEGLHALAVYDDLSKQATAYRTLSLLLRRPPGREAYPGDVFYLHSRLLERAAKLSDRLGAGSLTALPIVETKGNDISAYIPTNVISITDGQIYLEPDLFFAGVRPAINVGTSVSRVGGNAQIKAMRKIAGTLRITMAQYRALEAFAQFGSELDRESQKQLARGARVVEILKQPQYRPVPVESQVVAIWVGTGGYLDALPVEDAKRFVDDFIEHLSARTGVLDAIRDTGELSDEIEATLKQAVEDFTQAFVRSDAGEGSEAGVGQGAPRDQVKPDVGWDRLSSADDEDEPPGSGG